MSDLDPKVYGHPAVALSVHFESAGSTAVVGLYTDEEQLPGRRPQPGTVIGVFSDLCETCDSLVGPLDDGVGTFRAFFGDPDSGIAQCVACFATTVRTDPQTCKEI